MPNSTQKYHTKHRLTCVTHMLGNHNQNQDPSSPSMEAMMENHHNTSTNLKSNQCTSNMVQTINAPLDLVWSIIKRFEYPQGYKQFIKGCTMLRGNGGIGSVREVLIMSGLPAEVSVERLDKLDNDHHVLKFSIIGGDHRLLNYSSTTTLHEEEERFGGKTVVIESYVVDIPAGSSGEDTRSFTDTIIGCNLRSLAKITEGININQKHT